ncbi:sn-glycerol-3-phosphate ABC transporter substrate-binding protein UgpB [Salmonella enterica]|nr:sn-glycerol-3-phosphate ABC transporter substrate-binding protein UgpB [Salmonella enterica]EED3333140.1 sn-glycerol-3-phosphate ABC transporter substrate-binding protein UgpB [Salmonella enterica subsp. enterica]
MKPMHIAMALFSAAMFFVLAGVFMGVQLELDGTKLVVDTAADIRWQWIFIGTAVVFFFQLLRPMFQKAVKHVSGPKFILPAIDGSTVKQKLFLMALLVIAVAWPFMVSRGSVDIATMTMIYIILGLGLNVVVGLSGLLVLGYGGFYAIGAYTFALLNHYYGLGFWTCLPLAGLVSAAAGFLLGFPVLYYNKDAFKKAGLDPEQPPKTWQELADYTAKLRAAGMKCGYASGWQGWIQLENFSAWNGLPFASKNNGFDGTDAVLEFNKPEQVKHIALLEEMNKKGDFSYVGRKDESTEKFYNGDCAMTTASSGSLANIRQYAKFNYGVGMMPYDADIKGAPQNAIIGGASLWVMQGKDKETYTGVAKFLDFLAKPENAAEWHQKTGYLPITTAAYELTREQGYYDKNPGADIATRQMLNKPPLPFTKGLRLGNMPQIRTIVDEELESVWTGKKTPQQALDTAVDRGNQLLRRFEKASKS